MVCFYSVGLYVIACLLSCRLIFSVMRVEKLFSLNADRSLIDGGFEGYKLSFDSPSVSSYKLCQDVWQVESSASNFSYLQTRLLTLHNHLYCEPENDSIVYYFSSDKRLRAVDLSRDPADCELPVVVYDLCGGRCGAARVDSGGEGACNGSREACCPPSLVFVGERLAVVSDGCGLLAVADTGDRSLPSLWKTMFHCTYAELGAAGLSVSPSFHVLSSVSSAPAALLDRSSPWQLHILVCHVSDGGAPGGSSANFLTLVTLDIDVECESWKIVCSDQMKTAGTIFYSAVELAPSGESCVTAGQDRPAFVLLATDKPVCFVTNTHANGEDIRDDSAGCSGESVDDDGGESLYVWHQSDTEVRVSVRVPPAAPCRSTWKMLLSPQAVTVATEHCELLRLQLFDAVKSDDCASTWWSIDGSDNSVCLKLRLLKVGSGRLWPVLAGEITGSWATRSSVQSLGHETTDLQALESVSLCLQQLNQTASAALNQDDHRPPPGSSVSGDALEECDSMPEDTCVLLRLDIGKHSATHQCNLGAHQYVMTAALNSATPPSFCLRHDVDTLLWQPGFSSDNIWRCEHVGTLNAFGYIQASKTQRKFSLAPPDMSFAAICDVSRHVYIYRQHEPITGDVKNRRSGRRVTQISRQHVVSLDDQANVLGAAAFNNSLIILTNNYLHHLQLK